MTVTVFYRDEVIARGSPEEFAGALRGLEPLSRSSDLLAFDDETGAQVDLDLTGDAPPPRPRGRPSLGVEAREVTLLPRHWQWLAQRPGGASVTLRKLVEAAIRQGRGERECRDAAYRFLTVMAGNHPFFEDAIRALYRGDRARFEGYAQAWPEAVRNHARALAWPDDGDGGGDGNGEA
jgi:hypothetical protein